MELNPIQDADRFNDSNFEQTGDAPIDCGSAPRAENADPAPDHIESHPASQGEVCGAQAVIDDRTTANALFAFFENLMGAIFKGADGPAKGAGAGKPASPTKPSWRSRSSTCSWHW